MRWEPSPTTLGMVAAALAFAVAVAGQQVEPAARQPAEAAETSQVRRWVRDLDSDNFVARERAMQRLMAAGPVVIEPLVEAISAGSLEVTLRGMHVLRELALSDNAQVEQAARQALQTIAAARGSPAARRAEATLARLDELKETRATTQLLELGAELDNDNMQIGRMIGAEVHSLTIGKQWKGKPSDLQRLRWLRRVAQITLSGKGINDQCLRYVAAMPNVRNVIIKRAAITDAGIAHLRQLEALDHLAVMYCPITDQSVPHLKVHQKASLLKLYGTQITDEGAKRLEKALAPFNVTVDHRHGAFLGVGCQPHERGCEITVLHPDSAASRAGLQVGDVIVKYDGTVVTDFTQLMRLIAANRAGDTVTLEVLRDEQTLVKRITLGQWE